MIKQKKYLWLLAVVLMAAFMLGACSSGGSGAGDSGGAISRDTLGTSTILATGGTGSNGGNGGFIDLFTHSIKGITLSKSGTVDTAFTVPTYVAVANFGTNTCTVSSAVTADVYSSGDDDPGIGVLYTVVNSGALYAGTGQGIAGDDAKVCTGLKVTADGTLTLGLNRNNWTYMGPGMDLAQVIFTDDVEIAGTLKTADLFTTYSGTVNADLRHDALATSRDMGSLDLQAAQVFVRSTGSILTKGSNGANAGERGGDGGYLHIYGSNYVVNEGTIDCSGGDGVGSGDGGYAGVYANYPSVFWRTLINFYIESDGVFVNTGTIKGNGGNGAVGGSGVGIYVDADSHIYNTGAITANGGEGKDGPGGNATTHWSWGSSNQILALVSQEGSVFNSGALTANGGNGTISIGPMNGSAGANSGNGGDIRLNAGNSNVGSLVNSGVLTANGGNIAVGGCGGDGGNAGTVMLGASGSLKNSGDITLNGGNSYGSGYYAGDGGTFNVDNHLSNFWESELPVLQILISGNISLQGGSGYYGGNGGSFDLDQWEAGNGVSTSGVQLLGYASIDVSGADGVYEGGYAYFPAIVITTNSDHSPSDTTGNGDYLPAGPIVNDVPMSAKGGNATGLESSGGHGGVIYFSAGADDDDVWDANASSVTNSAKIDVSGGNAGNGGSGNAGGGVSLNARGGSVTNSGELNLVGGSARHGWGGDGAYDNVNLEAGINVVNTGAIKTTGGTGLWGGNGGNYIDMYAGSLVTNTGNIAADGGDAEVLTGTGGEIGLMSETKLTSNTGTLDVTPGADLASGDTPATLGKNGIIWLDDVDVTPATGKI